MNITTTPTRTAAQMRVRGWLLAALIVALGSARPAAAQGSEVYATAIFSGSVARIGPDGSFLGWFVQDAGFDRLMTSLTFDSAGNLYVYETGLRQIRRYAPAGLDLGVFASVPDARDWDHGMTFGPEGSLYVCAGSNIRQFSSAGDDLGVFANVFASPTPNDVLLGLAVDASGNLYVSHADAAASTSVIRRYSSLGTDLGIFATPNGYATGLAFSPTGDLLVTEHFYPAYPGDRMRIRRYSSAGADLGDFAQTGYWPNGVATDGSGNVWAASYGSGTINRFSATGTDLGDAAVPIEGWMGLAVKPSPSSTTTYLHGAGPANNPQLLTLDGVAPGGAVEKFKDSASLSLSGGNPWKEVGTWRATPSFVSGTITTLGDLNVWLGLKNSDDQGTRFDLRARVFRNDVLVSSGESYCIQGVTRNANQAKQVVLPFMPVSPNAVLNGTTDVLSIEISTRIGTNGVGAFCGGHSNAVGLRMYFDGTTRPARFGMTVQR